MANEESNILDIQNSLMQVLDSWFHSTGIDKHSADPDWQWMNSSKQRYRQNIIEEVKDSAYDKDSQHLRALETRQKNVWDCFT